MINRTIPLLLAMICLASTHAAEQKPATLWQVRFADTQLGRIPNGWRDLIGLRPTPGWAIDGNGELRATLKSRTGLIVYSGDLMDGKSGDAITDATASATFRKTEDDSVSFGLIARVKDAQNYYLARFKATDRLELIKVKDGVEQSLDFMKPAIETPTRPTGLVTLNRYREGERWTLRFSAIGQTLTARVLDGKGIEQARVDAIDSEFASGPVGLCCTRFASAQSFQIDAPEPLEPKVTADAINKRNQESASTRPTYPIVKPFWKTEELDTPRDKVKDEYDVVVAGGGTGGTAAAIQAARLGAKVLLLEETDWLGGQMCAAAVASMDEDGVYDKYPVRERGLYRQFHESITNYYYTLSKDPFVAYYSYPDQTEGGYEPKAALAVLYGLIKETRDRGALLDVSLRTRVIEVAKNGNTVEGETLEFLDESGVTHKKVRSKILIDATEYGDVIPLTGARYRSGSGTSDSLKLASLVQDHTWTCVLHEYPEGVPDNLKIKTPPPGYAEFGAKRWQNYTNDGFLLWGGAGKNIKGHRTWRVYFAWRGMADTESPLTGERSNERHTQCGFNGGNDYPVTSATLEDPSQRLKDERGGIYRTLQALYYYQHELGVNWSLATDEGFDTTYNRIKMKRLELRPDLEALAVYLPQEPYVRESRRIIGIRTLVSKDLTRFESAKLFPTSVAMGDYFMDLDHGGTGKEIETDIESAEPPKGGGPFQVPFEVFIPETIDGFVPAEKNISQSRMANGATRLQPITMLTGQAA